MGDAPAEQVILPTEIDPTPDSARLEEPHRRQYRARLRRPIAPFRLRAAPSNPFCAASTW